MTRRIRGLSAGEREEQRRTQLLDAALDLFPERGFGNTSVELLCQAAYVSTKSFYQLFNSREDCFLALYERTTGAYQESILASSSAGAAGHGESDGPAQEEDLIRTYVDLVVADRRKALVAFSLSRTVSDPVERARRRKRAWTTDFVEAVWASHGYRIPPRRVTAALVAGMFEVVIDYLNDIHSDGAAESPQSLADDVLLFYTTFRAGLAAHGQR
ncbi:TetR/AcrR family transcriptional regulator [Gordonia sp. MP11Mi]|uniref:HTH tetR-type domain-containing protein n=1 Tax=Gordonia sp. MP11Mi TaxID=3022769 RepID=A0AA97GVN8_9ACTN